MITPALIMVAPNGARPMKADHPALPVANDEIARAVAAAVEAGAGAAHVHVRGQDGRHVLDADLYTDLLVKLRGAIAGRALVQITTEAVGRYTPDEQRALVDAVRPEAVSLAVAELLPESNPAELEASLRWLEHGPVAEMAIQWICYSRADLDRLLREERNGRIAGGVRSVLCVVGRYAEGGIGNPRDLAGFMAGDLPASVMACGFGQTETASLSAALAFGFHARVGFENSLVHADGRQAADNAERVAVIAGVARALARPLAGAETARRLLGAPD